ncbi:hypothetical protein K491DRAFT_592012 [Lophiostoma macrostomum CBS 122681]|uniref:G-protein coupled receptors family 1 profile domain-containing protein n=1 Tax=Lophiostoma macrostomum CBS 122681 TaxID=1314788 RepID=A0A6A6TGH0_9PLEO|nr:hypothetical protein K491DRAFT_592012 [Lophiostoma macrostomum CBS 122681]
MSAADTIFWQWVLFAGTAFSSPVDFFLLEDSRRHVSRNLNSSSEPTPIVFGESQASRTIYTVMSLFCLSLLTGMLGYRARQMERQSLKALSLTRILVLVLYTLAICFVTSATVVESGLSLSSPSICHSAIVICLAFYVSSKATMYIFLVERAHVLRAPYIGRAHDWIWLVGMLSIATGFGSIAICGFLWPIADLSVNDGRCRIGLPLKVTMPLLCFDVCINMALTGTFIYLLRPLLQFSGTPDPNTPANRFTKSIRKLFQSEDRRSSMDVYPENQPFLRSIKALLWRSLIGSMLVMLPTVGNLAALYSLKGRELGWLCLTMCTFDVTWAVCVIHWLTAGSTEVDEQALVMLVQPGTANNASTNRPPPVT